MKLFHPAVALALAAYVSVALIAIFLLIFGRSPETSRISKFIKGSYPNFAVTALVPIYLCLSAKKHTYRSYSKFVAAAFVAMCFYEFIQIWMPRRTFDLIDIAASAAGAIVALIIGWIVPFPFFRASAPSTSLTQSGREQ